MPDHDMTAKRFVGLQLEIAIKLYARARGISIDDARDNVRDAALMQAENDGLIEDESEDDDAS
jgi:hypothetical protein